MGLIHHLARQARQPSGFFGKLAGMMMARANREGIEWTIELLDIQPTDQVLEVGFGPGLAIEKVAALASQGWVAGLDFSETMLQQAQKRNAAAIATGRVELRQGDVSALPLPYNDDTFTKVFAVNVIYFLKDPLGVLNEFRRVMKPGRRLALYMVAKAEMAKSKITQTGIFTTYTSEEVVRLLTQAGFHGARFETKKEKSRTGICALAEK